jgi:subtilisin
MRARRRHIIGTLVAVLALVISVATPAGAAERRGPAQVGTDLLATDSWIVMLVGDADVVDAQAIALAAGGRAGLVYQHAMQGFQFKGSAQAAAALEHNPQVASVHADAAVYLNETLPLGVERIAAYEPEGPDGAYQHGYRGAGARIAILDTGIDLDHPDLAASIDIGLGRNCVDGTLPPNDGYGHGTHVAGTAAAPLNGIGVVGVAPEASLVAVKMFDDAGNSAESLAICALDHIISLNEDADPANDVDVANMSWGEQRAWGDCASDPLHAAICRAHAAGITLVAGSGNSAVDAGGFVPAAYPEVISVSALADFDAEPGGNMGCGFVAELFWFECDDTLAFFSNHGPIDITAPGVQVLSTWAGGGWKTSSGTSMAAPHVAGIAALMVAAAPGLTPADARAALLATGECPNGQAADADGTAGCAGQGTWPDDPDGTPEPLGNALRAALAVAGAPPPPPPPPSPPSAPTLSAVALDRSVELSWTEPSDDGGAAITGFEVYRGTAAGGATLYATVGPDLAYVDTAVTNGATYWYQVAAINSAGVGTRSNEASVTPAAVATVPSAPIGLSAQKLRDGIRLTWSAPLSDGGAVITGYVIQRVGGAGSAQTFEVTDPTVRTYEDAPVAPRTWYTYTVAAVNAVGDGPPSDEVRVRSR